MSESQLNDYHALSSDERLIMQIIAMIELPLTQTKLKQFVKASKFKDNQGEDLSLSIDTPLKNTLLKKQLIVQSDSQYTAILCHPTLVSDIALETYKDGNFDLISRKVQQAPEMNKASYYDSELNTILEQRNLRIALFQGNETLFISLLDINSKHFQTLTACHYEQLLSQSAFHDKDWLDTRPNLIQFYLMDLYIGTQLPYLYSIESIESKLNDWQEKNPPLQLLLCEIQLLKGQTNNILNTLKPFNQSRSLGLQAWCLFLRGEDTLALETFELGVKVLKKEVRKRSFCYSGMVGLFHLLCLIRIGGKTNRQKAKTLLNVYDRQIMQDDFRQIYLAFASFLPILEGTAHVDSLYFSNYLKLKNSVPYECLFDGLLHLWSGQKIPKNRLNYLQPLLITANQHGWQWFAAETAMLLKTAGKTKNRIKPLDNITPLTALIKMQPAWERTLDNLISLSHQDQTNTGHSEQALRMTWRINLSNFEVEAREQKRTKAGGWTKGRAVALKKLFETPEDYPYLSNQDKQVCKQIEATSEYGGWGGHATNFYELDGVKALSSLVSHPHTFLAEDPSQSIKLDQGQPSLQVKKIKNKLHITLMPKAPIKNESVLEKKDAVHYRLYEFNDSHQHIRKLLSTEGLTVPAEAKNHVLNALTAIAPLLTIHSDIGGGNQNQAHTQEADNRLYLQLSPMGDGFNITAQIQPFGDKGPTFSPTEGSSNIFTHIDGKAYQTERDLGKEQVLAEQLLNQCRHLDPDDNWQWSLEEIEPALETLEQLQLLNDDFILQWPEGKKLKLSQNAQMSNMQVAVKKDHEWFGINGQLQLDDKEVIELQTLFSLLNQGSGRFIKLGENEYISLSTALRKRLEKIKKYSDGGRFHPLAAPAMEQALEGMEVKSTKVWKDQIKRLEKAQELEPSLPTTLQADLRDYQQEGFKWLSRLAHWGGGACLADDMGLGKTLQALALILNRTPKGPTLILAPTSVCMNWMSEAQRFAPTLNPILFGSSDRQTTLDQAKPFDLIVCSYGLLQTEITRLKEVQWHTLVADEAQAFKNSQTKRSQAVMSLSADYRMITTGTPIENHLGELWNLFNFINPGLLGNLTRFNERFATPIEVHNDPAAKDSLRTLISPFMLRRLKSDVLSELPAKTEITIQVELSKEEQVFYEAIRRQAIENMANNEDHAGQKRIKVLTEITRLRRACCHPKLIMPDTHITSSKLNTLIEIVTELRENKHKALIFSQFVGHLSLIREYLDKANIHYQYLDGSTPQKKRKIAVDAFQAGEGDLFLISLKAGGSGLNLTAADYVIHMDPWWNPAVEDQASDRAHRMGQQRPVTIYRLVAKNTIEEKIVAMHHSKRDLADSLLEGNEMVGKLSTDDIMNLIEEMGD